MKTAQQIIGLPVVSIFDGNEIGKVKNVIINASEGTVDFFIIDSGIRSLAGGVIPADRVLGIGEYALTIQQPDDISDIVKIPAAIELMQKNITVRGTRVLTRKGSLLGEAGDIHINDEGAYSITGVEFIPTNSSIRSGIIPRSSVITFGKNLLVVEDNFVDKLIDSPNGIDTSEEEKKNTIKDNEDVVVAEPEEMAFADEDTNIIETVSNDEEKDELFQLDGFKSDDSLMIDNEAVEEKKEPFIEPDLNIINDTSAAKSDEESQLSPAELFEQRQRQYLVGKKVTKTIYDTSGAVIVNAGEVITDKMIMDVKESGKLIELVMNYE